MTVVDGSAGPAPDLGTVPTQHGPGGLGTD